ncbi:MAG: helix-turn-helix domain-containing protein [Woeseia sp.]
MKDDIDNGGSLERVALRYVQALITQTGQTAICNRHHALRQQFCRWLLLSLDRLPSNEVNMTQELIANNLGVRREGVTEAAKRLESRGVIKYQRGHIVVLDRTQLEACVCECYSVVKREYERLLKHIAPQTCRKTSTLRATLQSPIRDSKWPAARVLQRSLHHDL